MNRMKTLRWALPALLLSMAVTIGRSEEFAIKSFDGTGRLTFNEISTATVYRVEWAPTPAGPWTNFTAAAFAMDAIVAKGSGIVTCSVPMCYRVVATVASTAVPVGMVLIPSGTNIGSDPYFGDYSLTNLAAFYMDATEVTKAKWDEVNAWAEMNGYSVSIGFGKASDHPVHSVSWYDCVSWCNARSAMEGRTPCYNLNDWSCNFSANGYRLPTYTEWEYAARGGLSGKHFPWGDTIDHTLANYYGQPSVYAYDQGYEGYDTRYATGLTPYTSPVGAFPANGYGLYDMAGNVWEWCNDELTSSARPLRGGSWLHYAEHACCRFAYAKLQYDTFHYVGFRAVCR